MSKKLYPEEDIQAIANAIRALNGSSDTYAVGDMADAIEMPDDAYYLKETEADNPLVITDGEELNAQSCIVEFEPIQDLHGYDNPWPAGGGKNKFNKDGHDVNNGYVANKYLYNGGGEGEPTTNPQNWFISEYIVVKPNTQYTISGLATSSSNAPSVCLYDSDKNYIDGRSYENNESLIITASATTRYVRLSAGRGQEHWDTIQLEEGNQATSYAPYSNICPISGRNSVDLNQCGANIFGGEILANAFATDVSGYTKDTTNKLFTFRRSTTSNYKTTIVDGIFKANTVYTFIFRYTAIGVNNSLKIVYSDETTTVISFAENSTKTNLVVSSTSGKTINRLELGYSNAAEVTVYYDESGVFEGIKTVADFEPYSSETHTVTFADTKYSGIIDMVSGKALIKWVKANMGSLAWTLSLSGLFQTYSLNSVIDKTGDGGHAKYTSKASIFKEIDANSITGPGGSNPSPDGVYALSNTGTLYFNWLKYDNTTDFIAAISNEDFVYKLATPIEVQLDPDVIKLLKGTNVFTTDGKNVKLTYLNKSVPSVGPKSLTAVGEFTTGAEMYAESVIDCGFKPDYIHVEMEFESGHTYADYYRSNDYAFSWWDLRPIENNRYNILDGTEEPAGATGETGIIRTSDTGFTYRVRASNTYNKHCTYIAVKLPTN